MTIITTKTPEFTLRPAIKADVPLILSFIKSLADYERLAEPLSISDNQFKIKALPIDLC